MPANALDGLYKTPLMLEAEHVRLEPLELTHTAELLDVAQDEEIWRWLNVTQPTSLDEMRGWISTALEAQSRGREHPFVVTDRASGRATGSTRYLGVRLRTDNWRLAGPGMATPIGVRP